jgi:PKD repeat protein
MVQLAFDGLTTTDPKWVACESYIRARWNSEFLASNRDARHYSYYAFAKAMRVALPAPVKMLAGNLDWYGDNTNGLARVLVDRQNASGYWDFDNWPYVGEQTAAAWNLIILSPTVFEAGSPVAVAQALPNPAVAGQVVQLDGTGSFHTDPNKSIVKWEWDLDDDGTFDVTGPFASVSFPTLGQYPVTLKVTDNGVGSAMQTAETEVVIRVTIPPLAPTADAGGPYMLCPESTPWFLDGTGSINPDDGQSEPGMPPDRIQEYAWELDGDNDFNDAFGPQPNVTAFFTSRGPGDYLVQLRVTDTTATSFPSSGQPNLSDVDSAQVHVARQGECERIGDLVARAKTGKVQLAWTDIGAHHYNVYRGTLASGPYMFLGQTDSRYSTYLDQTAVNDTTYYYVVRPADALDREMSQSNETSATPVPLNRRR